MRIIVLSMGRTLGELESNVNKYFNSDRYRIEGHSLMRRESFTSGARVHYEWREVRGYYIRQRKDCYQCCMMI